MKKFFTTTVKALTFFLGWAVLTGLMPFPDSSNGAVWRFWAELIPLLSAAGFNLLFWLPERQALTLHLCTAPLKSAMIGFAAGVLWLGFSTGVLLLTGTMHITGYQPVPLLGLWILSALLNTIMQELLIRGYLYQLIKTQYSTAAAAIATTALFTFLHGGALEAGMVPTFNVVTMSLLMVLVLEYTQCLLAPMVMHFLWNCIGGILLGGVSLAEDYPQLCRTEFTGSVLLSGGAPEMEGSIVVLFLNLLLIAGFAALLKKRKQ